MVKALLGLRRRQQSGGKTYEKLFLCYISFYGCVRRPGCKNGTEHGTFARELECEKELGAKKRTLGDIGNNGARALSLKALAEALEAIGGKLVIAISASTVRARNRLMAAQATAAVVEIDLAATAGTHLDNAALVSRGRGLLGVSGAVYIAVNQETGGDHREQRHECGNGSHARPKAAALHVSPTSSLDGTT